MVKSWLDTCFHAPYACGHIENSDSNSSSREGSQGEDVDKNADKNADDGEQIGNSVLPTRLLDVFPSTGTPSLTKIRLVETVGLRRVTELKESEIRGIKYMWLSATAGHH